MMKRIFFCGTYFLWALFFSCVFDGSVKAMERDVVGEDSPRKAHSALEKIQIEQNHKAEEKATLFLSSPDKQISAEDAEFLIDFASLSILEKFFSMQGSNKNILKKTCLERYANSFSYRRSFEIVHHLWVQQKDFITEDEKNIFLAKFSGTHGDAVFYLCGKRDAYKEFFKANKESLLKGTKGYMMGHKAALFWAAWIEYIELNPTEEHWEKAAEANRVGALSFANSFSSSEEGFRFRADQYKKRLRTLGSSGLTSS